MSNEVVLYGLDSSYGLRVMNADWTKDHELILSGLVAGETYYYLLKGKDPSGNEFTSTEYSFETPAVPTLHILSIVMVMSVIGGLLIFRRVHQHVT